MKKLILLFTLLVIPFGMQAQIEELPNGNVGIGTTTPENKLEVFGEENPSIMLKSGTGWDERLQFAIANCNGCFHPKATPGTAVIRKLGGSHNLILGMNNTSNDGTSNIRIIDSHNQDTFIVYNNGKVSIGTENTPTVVGTEDISNYKLFVKGGVLTDEVRVQTEWADYVFEPLYNLQPLSEVEDFIKSNKHLSNMPSAKQVKENGLELGNITKMQQEKIEELTLYMIQQEKEIQKFINQNLQHRLEKLEKLLLK